MPHEPVVLVLAAAFVVMKILCTKPLFDHFHSGIHAESRSTLPTITEEATRTVAGRAAAA
jgi:hypothetical protein